MSIDVIVRPAQLADSAQIYLLNRDSLGYDFSPERTHERLSLILKSSGHHMLVAERENCVVGYIHAVDYDCCYMDSLKDILALAVAPTCQGQGIGQTLLSATESWARECGSVGVRLNSGFGRDGAHRFYEACGYTNRKDQKNYVKLFG